MIQIRKTREEDLDELAEIYAAAREIMRRDGNPTQWGDHRPPQASIERDVQNGYSYVMVEDGRIFGAFSFVPGPDPTYQEIDGAGWLNDRPYRAIHKLASDGNRKGVFGACLRFCEEREDDLRIDTHENNHIMRHILEKNGFVYCGIIITDDGTPRRAYHKVVRKGRDL